MPFKVILGKQTVWGTRGKWNTHEASGKLITVGSLIDAFACKFAGYMTLSEMPGCFKAAGVTLGDFAEDDREATLAILQSRIRLARETILSERADSKRLEQATQALHELWPTFECSKFPLIAEAIRAGISQFKQMEKAISVKKKGRH